MTTDRAAEFVITLLAIVGQTFLWAVGILLVLFAVTILGSVVTEITGLSISRPREGFRIIRNFLRLVPVGDRPYRDLARKWRVAVLYEFPATKAIVRVIREQKAREESDEIFDKEFGIEEEHG